MVKTSKLAERTEHTKGSATTERNTPFTEILESRLSGPPQTYEGIVHSYRGEVYNLKFALKLAGFGMRSSG